MACREQMNRRRQAMQGFIDLLRFVKQPQIVAQDLLQFGQFPLPAISPGLTGKGYGRPNRPRAPASPVNDRSAGSVDRQSSRAPRLLKEPRFCSDMKLEITG